MAAGHCARPTSAASGADGLAIKSHPFFRATGHTSRPTVLERRARAMSRSCHVLAGRRTCATRYHLDDRCFHRRWTDHCDVNTPFPVLVGGFVIAADTQLSAVLVRDGGV
jgi:hypothetical protein